MGLLNDELEPGHGGLKPCPNCQKQAVGRRYKSDSRLTEYYCDECGYQPKKSEVNISFRELLGGREEYDEITDSELEQQVKDKETEGWEVEEVTHSGKRVVMSTTKGGTIGGHALTGVLTGFWTFGLGNAAYGKMSKKRNKQQTVLHADNYTKLLGKKNEEDDPIELIRELKQLNDEGIISDAEFEQKRQELLDSV